MGIEVGEMDPPYEYGVDASPATNHPFIPLGPASVAFLVPDARDASQTSDFPRTLRAHGGKVGTDLHTEYAWSILQTAGSP